MDEQLRVVLDQAVAVLKSAGAREIYVFGSAAGGTLREHSDLDLAVSGLPPERFFKALGGAMMAAKCPIDLIDLDEESPFGEYLKTHGKLQRVA